MNEVDYSWYEDRVEAFVDNDLPAKEALAFADRLQQDTALEKQVAAASALRDRLRSAPGLRCPPTVKAAVLEQTKTSGSWLGRWALPAAAAATLAIAMFLATPFRTAPSSQELAAARADLELALAYLDRASKRAALGVSEQVLLEGIIRPVQAGLDHRAPPASGSADQSEKSS